MAGYVLCLFRHGRGEFANYGVLGVPTMFLLDRAGRVNGQYSEAVRISGGIGPYVYSFTGQLPAGLGLDADTGIISGIPTIGGYTNVSFTVTDSTWPDHQSDENTLGIRTTSMLTITTPAVMPNARKGESISPVVLSAGGGPSPYAWAVIGGYLPSGISLNPVTGGLSGTPTDKGDFVVTIQATDDNGVSAQKDFFWHVSDLLAVTTGAIPDAAKGEFFNVTLEAAGGIKPYTWRKISGTLPDGLSFSNAGTISGRPRTRQSYEFTVEVSDADSPAQTDQRTYTIEVLDELNIYTISLKNGRIDEAYTATLQARLGTPPYTWHLESGVLPGGLTFTGSPTEAVIEGTPTETGTYDITVRVSDNGTPMASDTADFTIRIYNEVVIETTVLKNANRGIAYAEGLAVTGGTIPYTWEIVAGSLPAGLGLNSVSGLISGTTHQISGHSSVFTVKVTDSGNPSGFAEKELTLWVLDPMEITTTTLQKGLQKAPFQADFEAEGGIAPYTWSIAEGSPPAGVALDPETGILSGTPVVCGVFDFTVKALDSAEVSNTVSRALQLEVICVDVPKTTAVLSHQSPDFTVAAGSDTRVYGTRVSNQVMVESGAAAELVNFSGFNSIGIQGDSGLFTVFRAGTLVTFQGADGTVLRIPATTDVQTIAFADRTMILNIYAGQVMLDDQVIGPEPAAIEGPASGCGAYVAPGVWKRFDCYNLGAVARISNDDPFIPSWRLIGGYWQWGRKGPEPGLWHDGSTAHFAHGPTGPEAGAANSGDIAGWDSADASDNAWSDVMKTGDDPCPAGFRIPSLSQWQGVMDNNPQGTAGTWSTGWDDHISYSSARFFGMDLMLPAGGYRHYSTGALFGRGINGSYWSSSESTGGSAWYMNVYDSYSNTNHDSRRYGCSIRCVAE